MPVATLPPADLRLSVDPELPGVADTSALRQQPLLPWIGQQRAEQAGRFGLQMAQPDFNLLVLGEVGSGRSSLMHQRVVEQAATRPVPPDLCCLHNFERPCALRLPAGEGRQLRPRMADLARTLQTAPALRCPPVTRPQKPVRQRPCPGMPP